MNRTFTYNSLSRLTAAVQPESGTTTYTYWPNGNLSTRTDNRGAKTAVAYDALNRVTSKTYTLGGNPDPATPNVSFQYYTNTSVPSAYGQLHSMSTQAQGAYTGLVSTTTYDSFDALGRVTGSTQTTGTGAAKTMGYTWYANGEMHTETLPSGRLLTNALTGSGHVLSVTGQTSAGSQTYASGAQYGPQGVLSHVTLGNNLREDRGYDGLLRTQSIKQTNVGTNAVPLQFAYGFYADGNPQTIAAGAITQSFTFDGVNRLKTAQETTTAQTWFQQYNYDFAGNRWLDGSSSFQGQAPISQNWYDSTTNRVSAGYDGAGNILTLNNLTNSYDAEGRMTSSGNSTSGVVTYSYDGAGHRVTSSSYLGNKTFIYDAQDQLVAEYSDKASGTTGTLYLGMDGLGSTRVVTDASAAVVRCLDYLPFGEELSQGLSGRPSCFGNYTYPAGADDSVSEKFTGAKRDGETGLDFLESRYYAGYLGRFMSPDEPLTGQDAGNPQSWNLYNYGLNNPLLYSDPDGHEPCVNGINPENGNLCATGTAQGPGLNALQEFILRSVLNNVTTAMQVGQKAQEVLQPAIDYFSRPRNPSCMAAATGAGSVTGAYVGSFGLAGGPVVLFSEPAGLLIGGVAGGIAGLNTCMTGGGQSGDSSEGNRASGGDARLTRPQQRQTAKYLGLREVKGITSQGQPVFEKGGRYFSFSNTSHTSGEVFKELDRSGNRIATADLNLNRIGQ